MPIGVYERKPLAPDVRQRMINATKAYHAKKRESTLVRLRENNELICSTCKTERPASDFQIDAKRHTGHRASCKSCDNPNRKIKQKEYYHINKEKIKPKAKWYRHKLELNFTKEEYYKLLSEQSGACAICKESSNGNWLCIDHNHKTMKVRGLLCKKCNAALGMLKDSVAIVKTAAQYLDERGSYG